MWPWTKTDASDVKGLVVTLAELQARVDGLEGRVAEAQFRYLEGLDKIIGRLQGRLARQLRGEPPQDAPGSTIEEPEPPQHPPTTRSPTSAHLARRFRIGG